MISLGKDDLWTSTSREIDISQILSIRKCCCPKLDCPLGLVGPGEDGGAGAQGPEATQREKNGSPQKQTSPIQRGYFPFQNPEPTTPHLPWVIWWTYHMPWPRRRGPKVTYGHKPPFPSTQAPRDTSFAPLSHASFPPWYHSPVPQAEPSVSDCSTILETEKKLYLSIWFKNFKVLSCWSLAIYVAMLHFIAGKMDVHRDELWAPMGDVKLYN